MSLINVAFGQQSTSDPLVQKAFPSTPPTEQMTKHAALREAKVAALSNVEGDVGNLLNEFGEKVDAEYDGIYFNSPASSREQRALQNRVNRLMGTTSLSGVDVETMAGMAEAIAQDAPEHAIEREMFSNLEAIKVASADDDELEAWELEQTELFDPIADRVERQLHETALMQMATDAGIFDPQVPFETLEDFMQMMFIPFVSGMSRGDVMDIDERNPLSQVFFSGDRLRRESEAFRNLPRKEQLTRFAEIIAAVQDEGTLGDGSFLDLEWENKTLIRENIAAYIFGIDEMQAGIISFFDGADNAFALTGITYAGAKTGSRMMKLQKFAGARKALNDTLIAEIRAAELGERSPTRATTQEVVDEIVPDAVSVDRTGGTSGGPVATDTVGRLEDVAVLVREGAEDLNAATPAQMRDIVERSVKAFEDALPGKRKVVDVQVENATPGSGIYTPRLKVVVGTGRNTGYRDPNAMIRWANSVGIDDAVVVRRPGDDAGDVFDVNPKNDIDYETALGRLADDTTLADDFKILVNPSEEEARALFLAEGQLKVIATKEGNVFMAPGAEIAHLDLADELGLSLRNVGRGFYDGKDQVGGAKFSFSQRLRSIDKFEGPDEPKPFGLRRTKVEQSDELKALSSKVDEANAELTAANRELSDIIATREDNFLRLQAGTERVAEKFNTAKKAQIEAQKKYDEALAAYEEAGGTQGRIVQKEDGTYYMEFEIPLHVQGTYRPLDRTRALTGPLARLLASGRAISDRELFNFSTLSDSTRNAIINVVRRYISPALRKPSRAEKRLLTDIADDMLNEERWFTEAEVIQRYQERFPNRSRVPSRFMNAYAAYRDASDLEYFIRNSELYNHAALDGYQTVRIDTPAYSFDAQNGRILRQLPSALPEGRILDTRNGSIMNTYRPSEIASDGSYVVTLQNQQSARLASGERVFVKHIVVKRNEVKGTALERAQLAYKAGGSHVEYGPQVRVWAKQAVREVQEDTGEEFLMNPRTYAGGTRPSDLKDYVGRMNDAGRQAQRLLRGEITEVGLKRILRPILTGPKGLPTPEEYIQRIRNWQNKLDDQPQINPNEPLEIVGDRQLPSAYTKDVALVNDVDTGVTGQMSFLDTQSRLYYGRRGSRMTDAEGRELPTLDPFTAMDRALSNVAKIGGMTAYRRRAANQFLATHGDIIRTPVSANTDAELLIRQMYDQQSLFGSDKIWKQGADPRQVSQAKNELAVMGRVLNWQTKGQRDTRSAMISLANQLDEWSNKNIFARAASDALHWSMSTDFSYGLRQMAFDVKLGLFNFAQVPLQVSTALAMTAVDSVGAARAYLTYPLVRAYVGGRFSPKMLRDHMLKVADKTGIKGRELDDFIDMVTELRTGGYTNVTGQQLQGDISLSSTSGVRRNPVGNLLEVARTPFNEAEVFNRTTAFQVAWRKIAKEQPNLEGQARREALYGMTNDLAFNMTHNARAAWQAGPLSLAFQFFAYPARWLELMFVGNSSLSTVTRGRLIASQSLLYGTTGTFILSQVNNMLKEKAADSPEFSEDFVGAAIDRGAIDALVYLATGQESRYADVATVYPFMFDYVDTLFGNSPYGETAPIDVLGGASISIGREMAGDFADVIQSLSVELSMNPLEKQASQEGTGFLPFTSGEFNELLKNVSSINNATKAYAIWKSGELKTKKGRLIADDLDMADAITSFFNIPLQEQDILSAKMGHLQDRNKTVDEHVAIINEFNRNIATGDTPEERLKWRRLKALYYATFVPDTLRPDIIRDESRYPPSSMLESVTRRTDRIQLTDAVAEALAEELEENSEEVTE